MSGAIHSGCGFSALEKSLGLWPYLITRYLLEEGAVVRKIAVAMALVIASLSLGGCFVGKGKTPPPSPVISKG